MSSARLAGLCVGRRKLLSVPHPAASSPELGHIADANASAFAVTPILSPAPQMPHPCACSRTGALAALWGQPRIRACRSGASSSRLAYVQHRREKDCNQHRHFLHRGPRPLISFMLAPSSADTSPVTKQLADYADVQWLLEAWPAQQGICHRLPPSGLGEPLLLSEFGSITHRLTDGNTSVDLEP
jgi:hypothetical protein